MSQFLLLPPKGPGPSLRVFASGWSGSRHATLVSGLLQRTLTLSLNHSIFREEGGSVYILIPFDTWFCVFFPIQGSHVQIHFYTNPIEEGLRITAQCDLGMPEINRR